MHLILWLFAAIFMFIGGAVATRIVSDIQLTIAIVSFGFAACLVGLGAIMSRMR